MKSARQTISYLQQRFREIGIRPNTRHGQNFLIDLNLIEFLAYSADIQKNDVVLEVGTGMGSLTAKLAERACQVVTVEIDEQLSNLAQEELSAADNVTFLQQDALRNKNSLHENVLDTVRQKLSEGEGRAFKLVANLPYNIATPVISNLLLSDPYPDAMTVTIQKELADRLTASPSTKDYGSLSVWVQSVAFTAILRELPPSVFWPRPKVTSAIVQIVSDPQKRAMITDLGFFHRFVRTIFLHRRKFLRGSLLSAHKHELDKPDVDAIMRALEFGTDSRAEQLSIEQLYQLSVAVKHTIDSKQEAAS